MSSYQNYLKNSKLAENNGLYDPQSEHDACGVGFVASIDGVSRRDVLDKAIGALGAVWHRGAVDSDGKTGDGAGIKQNQTALQKTSVIFEIFYNFY